MEDRAHPDQEHVTSILRESAAGDRTALDRAFPIVYEELRRLARRQLARHPRGQTITTTVLIHEAYLRLVNQEGVRFEDRAHFFAYAARVMRTLLVDAARARGAQKRAGDQVRVEFDGQELPVAQQTELILSVDKALGRLAAEDERLARIVECRFFGGLTDRETADALGVTDRTVRREWIKARVWLRAELSEPGA